MQKVAKAKDMKVCSWCKIEKDESEFYLDKRLISGLQAHCKECGAAKRKIWHKENYSQNAEKIRARNNAFSKNNRPLMRIREKTARLKRRMECLLAYAVDGKIECSCCHEREIKFLAIDHIGGNGNKHRKEIGTNIYAWLKRNNYPKGFRILCHNCNLAEGFYGTCPHNETNIKKT